MTELKKIQTLFSRKSLRDFSSAKPFFKLSLRKGTSTLIMNRYFFFLVGMLFFTSCVQYRDIISYHEAPGIPTEPQTIMNYSPVLVQPNDILSVGISATTPEAVAPFNSGGSSYMVNESGNIELPTLGPIRVENMTIEAIKLNLKKALKPYFSETPIVNVRLTNFKINVNGEIGSPGVFQIKTGRVTIVEAMTLAGDFTPYSRRDSILIIREFDGERTFGYVNFNSSEVFNSPYFYLKQNDVIYIKPKKEKLTTVRDQSSRALPYISIATSLAVLTLTLIRAF